MQIKHHTAPEADGARLYYRTSYDVRKGKVGGHYRGPTFIPPKMNGEKGLFRILDTDNVLCQLRLYRHFSRMYRDRKDKGEEMSGLVLKDNLMSKCFYDSPQVTKVRVGRLLRLILPYEPNFQRNPSESTGWRSLMFWRWQHPLEITYGLEHLMILWLPRLVESDGGECRTSEDFLEELEIIRDQPPADDRELIDMIVKTGII